MKKRTQKIKKIVASLNDNAYHSRHKKRALKLLKSIESVNGKTDKKLIKLSNEYATDILGWKGYAPWLYVYSAIQQTFKEGWIPDNYYGRTVVPKIAGNYDTIDKCNSLVSTLFNCLHFPNCAYYNNGLWLSTKYQILSDKDIIEDLLDKNSRLVYKIDNSKQGKGVHFIDKDNFDINKLKRLGNGVLQKYINQHSFFDDISPNSVATLRITSVINDTGIASVKACYLRVGRSTDTHVKSNSHIRIPINISNGVLDSFGYNIKWHKIDKHPDTNFLFDGKKVPHFSKFIDVVLSLHKMIPFMRAVGWDMTIDSNNEIQVMEWNGGHNDIKFSEATQGPCFSNLGWEKLWKENN